MTQEEKAKSYDEAIDKVAYFIKKHIGFGCMIHPNSSEAKELFNIFPELKESEDDESKKWILEYLYDGLRKSDEQFKGQFKAAIAWLEKQGKQKPSDKIEPKFKVKYAGSEYNVLEVKDIAGVTYYGIEDEPNHIDYVLPDNCEIVGGYSIKENGSPYPTKPAVFSEQNSAWSEDDERICSCIIEEQEESLDNVKNDKYGHSEIISDLKEMYRERIDWLKSLKQRIGG